MSTARDLRLQADYEQARVLAANSGGRLVLESTKGQPPDEYILTYHCRSIEALKDGKPVYRNAHRVRVKLPARYPAPSAAPVVEMQTPIFNPHVYVNRVVCMGSWQTTEYLEDVILRLGAMLQFDRRYMDILDPANEQAMFWVTRNLLLLPTDNITFMGDDPPIGAPPNTAVNDGGLPDIGVLMRQAGEQTGKSTREPSGEASAVFSLREDTSLVWEDLE